MPKPPAVMSILQLEPFKYGSKEEYTALLSRTLQELAWRSILVFEQPVPSSVRHYFDGSGAILEYYRNSSRLRRYADIFRIIIKYRPDAVHFHFFNHFTILPIIAWLSGVRAVVFTDELRQPNQLSLRTKLECLFWDRVVLRITRTKVVAVSDFIKRTLVSCYGMTPERIDVILNGVNPDRFAPVSPDKVAQIRQELGISTTSAVVICASHLRPGKGLDFLLEAAQIVLESKPHAFFGIVGEGPMTETLRAQAKTLGIERKVQFFGRRTDVHRFMASADVVAVPTAREWQDPAPFSVIEGMAMGRPVVATRVGGIPEYLEHNITGLLVEPNSPGQLAQALIRLIDSPDMARTMGEAGRARVVTVFPLQKSIEDTVTLFTRLLTPRPAFR